ncbi:MAG: single-stranded-DNA-specific exonuclease RecJ [Anaerolineales bacterium]|nr:single-stranded-DNA-specific exonuclease RecJ [Anaerolineales bacterium]
MMATWIEPEPVNIPVEIEELVGGRRLLAEMLIRRGFKDFASASAFLDPDQYQPASAAEFPGMDRAVDRLVKAIQAAETICVWGDFDVDGQTATSLLVSALQDLGARVVYHIPIREHESHGIKLPFLGQVLDGKPGAALGGQPGWGPVSLLLTCDCGVSAHQAIDYARQRGVETIVTDHHELPEELPAAFVILNPRLLPDGHRLSGLPGVGVAYKLVEALYDRLDRQLESYQYLDLVALGIVADVAPQQLDTRYLLQRGLVALRQTRRAGLLAILELAELEPGALNEEHIGFELAPRLNALGRLGDANPAVELLTTSDFGKARLLAAQIEGMNESRKLLTSQVFQGALSQLERNPDLAAGPAVVLDHPEWPGGILGIVASRLVEYTHKPVFLISSPPGALARGSARSVAGLHLASLLKTQAALLEEHGGHARAAGFSLSPERINDFRRSLWRALDQAPALPEPALAIDAYLELSELSLDLAAEIEKLAPFGAGNPPLVLASRDLQLVNVAPVGRGGEHLSVLVEDLAGVSQKLIWWQGAGWPLPEGRFDLAFSLRGVTFRGQRSLQLEWLDFRSSPQAGIQAKPLYQPVIEDLRQIEHPLSALMELMQRGHLQVWAEGDAVELLASKGIAAVGRAGLVEEVPLAVWTPPPGPEVLQAVIQRTRPGTIYLFSVMPRSDDFNYFLNRLAGMVKFCLRQEGGQALLVRLAAGLAQREITVLKGLEWMREAGYLRWTEPQPGQLRLEQPERLTLESENPAEQKRPRQLSSAGGAEASLKLLLEETRFYRNYYARVEGSRLVSGILD